MKLLPKSKLLPFLLEKLQGTINGLIRKYKDLHKNRLHFADGFYSKTTEVLKNE